MIDVRVIKPEKSTIQPEGRWDWIDRLTNSYMPLVKIDLDPPTSGPELELTFDADEEALVAKQCREVGLHVLTSRSRS